MSHRNSVAALFQFQVFSQKMHFSKQSKRKENNTYLCMI